MKKIRRSLAVFIAAFVMITGAGLLTEKTVSVQAEDNVTAFVDRMYQVCLGREADEEGRADWVNRLQTGEARGADVAYGFVFSTEFRNMNLCNSCYVDAMYQAFFGRTADEAGKADWMNRLAEGQTRGAVMTGFVLSLIHI